MLPGFIDVHTHVLVQGGASSEEYDTQLLKQSIPYRAILAARNVQIALSHGFTALRDLETEGAMYAAGLNSRSIQFDPSCIYSKRFLRAVSDLRHHSLMSEMEILQ
ncbi:MAG TPA: hypothetical protein VM715_07385 [Candidatus Acidoferrum sp.]|nr:hypothetical protein [Candidatus Acidoferrum sp.]